MWNAIIQLLPNFNGGLVKLGRGWVIPSTEISKLQKTLHESPSQVTNAKSHTGILNEITPNDWKHTVQVD